MPSPALGAGPFPGLSGFCLLGWSKPLPSGIQSPEFGAGPTLFSAATTPQTMLAQTKSSMAIPTIFFMLFPPGVILEMYSTVDLRDIVKNPFQKLKHLHVYKNLKRLANAAEHKICTKGCYVYKKLGKYFWFSAGLFLELYFHR
jgi:hypothetical protein